MEKEDWQIAAMFTVVFAAIIFNLTMM